MSATDATGATAAPFVLGNFGNSGTNSFISADPIVMPNGVITFAPYGSSPYAGVYDGNVANVAASAYGGTSIAPQNHLGAEPNDTVNSSLYSAQSSFSLLWGSVDSYNSVVLTFVAGGTSTSMTVTGSEVHTAGATYGSPAFVTVTPTAGFTQVMVSSTSAAFEFVPSVTVPEPATLALLGAGLAGLGLARRRKAHRVG